jgi:uncharacterized membrane protein
MNLEYFTQASLAIQIHIAVAVGALLLGIIMLVRRKGGPSHRLIGRGFMVLMLATATSAIFIRELNDGSFSWIHIFIPLTFFTAWEAIHYVRKGNIKRHRHAVLGLFFLALLIPGVFSFMPGRTMWMIFFA